MRTFIAIDLNKNLKEQISLLCSRLDRGNRKIRWVKSQGMHLTLKFLGEISHEKKAEVENALNVVTREFNSFPLHLAGTGIFPRGKTIPRVLWVGIKENKTLKDIHVRLEEELEKIGFSKENRAFHPHLTLARVRPGAQIDSLLKEFHKERESEYGVMEADRITFFLSTLKPTGAEYTVLSEFRLK